MTESEKQQLRRLIAALVLLVLGIALMLCSYWFDHLGFVWAAIVVLLSGNFLTYWKPPVDNSSKVE